MKSLYAEYYEERTGGQVLEVEGGFVAYKVTGQEVFIDEIYVRPALRKTKSGAGMLDRVGDESRALGCKFMTCSICPAANGSSEALAAAIAYGFRLHSTDADRVFLAKEI